MNYGRWSLENGKMVGKCRWWWINGYGAGWAGAESFVVCMKAAVHKNGKQSHFPPSQTTTTTTIVGLARRNCSVMQWSDPILPASRWLPSSQLASQASSQQFVKRQPSTIRLHLQSRSKMSIEVLLSFLLHNFTWTRFAIIRIEYEVLSAHQRVYLRADQLQRFLWTQRVRPAAQPVSHIVMVLQSTNGVAQSRCICKGEWCTHDESSTLKEVPIFSRQVIAESKIR